MLITQNTLLIEKYLKEHPDTFTELEKDYLLWYSKNWDRRREVPYFVLELYDELGILPDDRNVYNEFMDLLEEEVGVDGKNILEVGGGILPRLGERIALSQNRGSLTIYDPRLSREIESSDSFVLLRENFTRELNGDGYDLVVGLKPCDITEDIIRWAIDNKVNFMIGLCDGGLHGEPYDFYDSTEEWLHSMRYIASRGVEEQQMGKLYVKKLDGCDYNYPVIYNK